MTEVNAVDQKALQNSYTRAKAAKQSSNSGTALAPRPKAQGGSGVGPAAILELSSEAKELIKKQR
jgi:hypothetical protein